MFYLTLKVLMELFAYWDHKYCVPYLLPLFIFLFIYNLILISLVMQILILWLNAWNKAVVIWLKSLLSKIFLICNSAHFFSVLCYGPCYCGCCCCHSRKLSPVDVTLSILQSRLLRCPNNKPKIIRVAVKTVEKSKVCNCSKII